MLCTKSVSRRSNFGHHGWLQTPYCLSHLSRLLNRCFQNSKSKLEKHTTVYCVQVGVLGSVNHGIQLYGKKISVETESLLQSLLGPFLFLLGSVCHEWQWCFFWGPEAASVSCRSMSDPSLTLSSRGRTACTVQITTAHIRLFSAFILTANAS